MRASGRISIPAPDAVQPRPAGDPPAGRQDQRAAGDAADQLQGGALRFRRVAPPSCGSCSARSRRSASTPAMRMIELPVKLKVHEFDFRAAGQMGDAVHRQLSLRAEGRRQSRSRRRCTPTSRRRARVYDWVRELCMKLGRGARRSGAVREIRRRGERPGPPVVGRARACSPARRTSSAWTGWCRASRRSTACAMRCWTTTVALVDARLEMNRKAAA